MQPQEVGMSAGALPSCSGNCSPSSPATASPEEPAGKRKRVQQGHSPLSTKARCLLKQKMSCISAVIPIPVLENLLSKLRDDFPELHLDSDIHEGWIIVSRCVSSRLIVDT